MKALAGILVPVTMIILCSVNMTINKLSNFVLVHVDQNAEHDDVGDRTDNPFVGMFTVMGCSLISL